MSEATLFVHRASGLVRSWSVLDAFIYATFSINLITLGLYIFSYSWYFQGNMIAAILNPLNSLTLPLQCFIILPHSAWGRAGIGRQA